MSLNIPILMLLIACHGAKPVLDNAPQEIKKEKTEEVVQNTFETPVFQKSNHDAWNALLKQFVANNGVVNYKDFKGSHAALTAYITSLSKSMPDDSWSKNAKLAYWMNAYNAMTIDLILKNYPLKSIKEIDKPWDVSLWELGGKHYSLNEIEHQILRKMGDARIHFGINCASFSCPPLLNEAFTEASVNKQLDFLAKRFINDKTRNTIAVKEVKVSKIFSWFAKDFKTKGTLIDFLNMYSEVEIKSNAKKSFRDYNWELNE